MAQMEVFILQIKSPLLYLPVSVTSRWVRFIWSVVSIQDAVTIICQEVVEFLTVPYIYEACCHSLEVMKLSVVRTSLSVLWCRNSKGIHLVGHVRHMISEVIRESDGLEDCLLNCGFGKVKDLQAFLWSEWGARREDEVTNVFNLL